MKSITIRFLWKRGLLAVGELPLEEDAVLSQAHVLRVAPLVPTLLLQLVLLERQ